MLDITKTYDSCMTDAWDDDPGFDARELRVVKAIADEGSITGAALALGYSQPAVSQQLKRLEQRLGVALEPCGSSRSPG